MIGSYFCLIPGTELAFVMVSKNAVTFLKRIALQDGEGDWPTGFRETHDRIGDTDSSPYLVRVADTPVYEARHGVRRKFAVWRDPVARLESTFSLFVLQRTPHV